MKTEPDNKNDETLRALLHEWNPPSALAPRFKEDVWKRIEKAESTRPTFASKWAAFVGWIADTLPRPAPSVACATILLVAGAGVGWTQARQETAQVAADLGSRYVRSVDPYQATP